MENDIIKQLKLENDILKNALREIIKDPIGKPQNVLIKWLCSKCRNKIKIAKQALKK